MSVSSITQTGQYLTFKLEDGGVCTGYRQGPGSPGLIGDSEGSADA